MTDDSHAVKIFKLEFNACTNNLAKLLKPQGWHGVIVACQPEVEGAWIITQTVGENYADLEQAQTFLQKASQDAP